jgi:hypothetical protein
MVIRDLDGTAVSVASLDEARLDAAERTPFRRRLTLPSGVNRHRCSSADGRQARAGATAQAEANALS